MENSPIDNYLTKFNTLHEATEAVEAMIRIIQQGAKALDNENWQRISTPTGKFPQEVTRIDQFFPIDNWPTKERISQLITQWHLADQEAKEAYGKVPDNQRKGLQPPPGLRFFRQA